jgi:hypothetical protein
VVVDEEPDWAVVDGKLAAVHPLALAAEVIVALPDVVADQIHQAVNPPHEDNGLVAGHEMRFCLYQDADRPVMVGRVGVGWGVDWQRRLFFRLGWGGHRLQLVVFGKGLSNPSRLHIRF